MAAGVDLLMAECPLKHQIRVSFWLPFIKKLNKKTISYLTLYSPPLMDVKYFHKCGFINVTADGQYSRVVGVGLDEEAIANSITELQYRPELLIYGDINSLLNKSVKDSNLIYQLYSNFPFDVINLDYTDSLHRKSLDVEISPHINAIGNIIKKQNECGQTDFILFLTTYADIKGYNKTFLKYLKGLIDNNIEHTPDFSEKLNSYYKSKSGEELFKKNKEKYFSLSLPKLILKFLKDYNYTMSEGDFQYLIRDETEIKYPMLHIAMHITRPNPPLAKKITYIGTQVNKVEYKSVKFIKRRFTRLTESNDKVELGKIHNAEISELRNLRFEIITPEPEN